MKLASVQGYEGLVTESFYTDLEANANTPSSLLHSKSLLHTRGFARTAEIIELDDIPPIIKSANGNLFWADEQCTRRVGPTATEARLFLKLLQMDEPEMLNYSDYKDMFDDFHREKIMLEKLVSEMPWWRFWEGRKKKQIWKRRIEWLERIREPRLWLLYLMARRRRILQQAIVAIIVSLRAKRLRRTMEFIPLQTMAVMGGGAFTTSTMTGESASADIAQELQEYKTKLEQKFGARPLTEVLGDFMTHSDQESLARRVPGGGVLGGPQLVELTEGQQDRKEPQIMTAQVDGPPSPPTGKPVCPVASNDSNAHSEANVKVENNTPNRSKIVGLARGVRSSVRSSIRSRQRGWSYSSDQTARPRIPGRCPIFNMRFEATRKDIKQQVERLMPKPMKYIVIGYFVRTASDPKEHIIQFEHAEEIFQHMRCGVAEVRGWRRFISLKTLKGFGLYKCDVERGAHRPLTVSNSQKVILSQFFLAYQASYRHADDAVAKAWESWVQKNLNGEKDNPLEGKYSLQLIYTWSSYRLTLIVAIPVLLSFAVGLWYTRTDVGAAWTVAGYIISAAALLAALLAIIGSLRDN